MKARILLVDDNFSLTTLLRKVLAKWGFEGVEVNDPTVAVATAHQCRPDLILLDVMMPVMDGGDVLEQLRADVELRNIPVILLTALSAEAGSLAWLGGGSCPVIGKPVEFRELMAQIENSLSLAAGYQLIPPTRNATPRLPG